MKRSLLVVVLAALMLMASMTAAFAGEVKGPPGSDPATHQTAAPTHANSICAFSGLNDYPDGSQSGPPGQVQSWGQDVKSGLYSPHDFTPGDACRGGSNEH